MSFVSASMAWSKNGSGLSPYTEPTYFPPEKNNVKILQQKFEYDLIDANQIRLGDILIDARNIRVSIVPQNGRYHLQFVWPARLLMDGQIIVKNQVGKSIFNEILRKEKVQLTADELATYESNVLDTSLIESLVNLPFFTFCVLKQTSDVEVNLCSKELYISQSSSGFDVHLRDENMKSSFVEIDGQPVSGHGIIFLSSNSQSISFRAQATSGTLVEVSSQRTEFEMLDLVAGKDSTSAILTARGAEPIGKVKILETSSDQWKAELPTDSPHLYIRATGDIPLRQDLLITESLPTEEIRPHTRSFEHRTYSDSVTLFGILAKGTSLESSSDSIVESNPKTGTFRWTLANLQKRTINERTLTLKTNNRSYTLMQEVFRGAAGDISADALSPIVSSHSPSGGSDPAITSISGALHVGRWWNSHKRLGSYLSYRTKLIKLSSEITTSRWDFDLLYRFTPGIYNDTPTWGASLDYQAQTLDSNSINFLGIGIFNSTNYNKLPFLFGHWQLFSLKYFPSSVGGTLKNGSSISFSGQAKYFVSPTLYLNGVGDLEWTNTKDSNGSKVSFFGVNIGLGFGLHF